VTALEVRDAWEEALRCWLLRSASPGIPFYFAVDDTALVSIAAKERISGGAASFIVAARSAANSASGVERDHLLASWNDRRLKCWLEDPGDTPPPCLVPLATDVLAASRMYDQELANPSSFYARLREILGLPTACRQIAGYGDAAHTIWPAFNRWLRSLGIQPTAAARPNTSFAHTGFAVSQALVNGVDRSHLFEFFAAIGLPTATEREVTGEAVDADDLLHRLREWDRRTRSLRPQFRGRLEAEGLTDDYRTLLTALAAAWDGGAISETGERLLTVHLAVYDATDPPELGRVICAPDELVGTRIHGRVGAVPVDVTLERGWNHLVDVDVPAGAGAHLDINRSGWQLTATAPTLVRRILDADCYTDGPGEGPLFALGPDGRTLRPAADTAVVPGALPRLRGGLRLDSRHPVWLASGPPVLTGAVAGTPVQLDEGELGVVDSDGEFPLPAGRELSGRLAVGGWSHHIELIRRLREVPHAPTLRHVRDGAAYQLLRGTDAAGDWLCGAAVPEPARRALVLSDVHGAARMYLLGAPGEIHEIVEAAPSGHRHARGLEWSVLDLNTLHVRPGVAFRPWWVASVRSGHVDVWRCNSPIASAASSASGWWHTIAEELSTRDATVHNAAAEDWVAYLTGADR
jgi:hypothetical protein